VNDARGRWRPRLIAAFVGLLTLNACTSVPFDAPREASRALPPGGTAAETTALRLTGDDPERAALVPLADGNDALGARLGMIEEAERSIDIKTFLIKPDIAGALVWLKLYEAAERGVRVRLLYDDVFTTARDDQIAALDAHPNVEIRVFNPLSRRSPAAVSFLLDFPRVNRRMHNKAMIVDGAFAIIGGRNIADEYYQIGTENEFADFDLFVAGGPVRELAAAFDLYWNDVWSVPLSTFETGDAAALADALDLFRQAADSPAANIYRRAVGSSYLAGLRDGSVPVYTGRASVAVDDPRKLRRPPGRGPYFAGEALFHAMRTARSDVLVLTPYFVPEDYGAAFFEDLARRGVRVRIATNSLASTNHPYVHGAYARYRNRLLAAGVEFLEVRADAPRLNGAAGRPLTMHTKLAVADGRVLFVGSSNIDPRSIRQNTEIGMVIESPRLARGIVERIDAVAADYTFEVVRGPDGRPLWRFDGAGRGETFDDEPLAGALDHLIATISGWLPIESQL
jgi:putative cardiolipin synthase